MLLIIFASDKIGQKVSDATRVLMEQYDKVNEKLRKSRLVKAFPKLHKKEEENN